MKTRRRIDRPDFAVAFLSPQVAAVPGDAGHSRLKVSDQSPGLRVKVANKNLVGAERLKLDCRIVDKPLLLHVETSD